MVFTVIAGSNQVNFDFYFDPIIHDTVVLLSRLKLGYSLLLLSYLLESVSDLLASLC